VSATRGDDPVRPRPSRPAFGPTAVIASIVIVVTAGVLRLSHIGIGIPHNVGVDEPQIMNRVVAMMRTGDLNPHFFDWPSLTFYLNLVVSCLVFMGGAMRGLWGSLDQVSANDLYLGGRIFTALVGTATVGLTIAAARRWSTTAALVAGALMAVVPGHVRESHYVLTDVPTAFFTTLTLLLALRALEKDTMGRVLWAAAMAGLAASCKYNGGIALIMPLIVVWSRGGGMVTLLNRTLAVAGIGLAAFLAGTPYAVLDLPKFLNDYARLASMFANRAVAETGWTIYPKHILGAIAWPAVIASLVGAALALRRFITGPGRAGAAALLAFAILYFMVMARSHQMYARYLLPLYPCLCVFCGLTASAFVDALRQRRMAGLRLALPAAAFAIVLLAMPASSAIGMVRSMGQTSTGDLAYRWFLDNVPKGTKVAVEAGALLLPGEYQTVGVPSLLRKSYADYVADGVTYFLAASADFQGTLSDPVRNPEASAAYRTFFSDAVVVAAFDPLPNVTGPRLRIYRIAR
jgi:hypothetical protein